MISLPQSAFLTARGTNAKLLCLYTAILTVEGLIALPSWKDPEDRRRDTCPSALRMVEEALREPEKQYVMCVDPEVACSLTARYLSQHIEVLSLGVHPAYWNNDCGHELVRWCIELADKDQMPLGVSCAPMGAKACKNLGFVEREVVTIKGHQRHFEDITISFQQRSVLGKTIGMDVAEQGWKDNVIAQLRTEMMRLRTLVGICAKVAEALVTWEFDPLSH